MFSTIDRFIKKTLKIQRSPTSRKTHELPLILFAGAVFLYLCLCVTFQKVTQQGNTLVISNKPLMGFFVKVIQPTYSFFYVESFYKTGAVDTSCQQYSNAQNLIRTVFVENLSEPVEGHLSGNYGLVKIKYNPEKTNFVLKTSMPDECVQITNNREEAISPSKYAAIYVKPQAYIPEYSVMPNKIQFKQSAKLFGTDFYVDIPGTPTWLLFFIVLSSYPIIKYLVNVSRNQTYGLFLKIWSISLISSIYILLALLVHSLV